LHEIFEQFGEIKSVKESINPDYSSRGYGFVCYQNVESARNALSNKPDQFVVYEFNPKDVKKS
jgi:RNA recognition motif-containing protein